MEYKLGESVCVEGSQTCFPGEASSEKDLKHPAYGAPWDIFVECP